MTPRVVFDTNTVVSALLFRVGRLAWLRLHWAEGGCVPLISHETAGEMTRVLGYPKFQLSIEDRRELLAECLPYCEIVPVQDRCPAVCRDTKDQMFLDLAQSGNADVLVSGDRDLLELAGETVFRIQAPEVYRAGMK